MLQDHSPTCGNLSNTPRPHPSRKAVYLLEVFCYIGGGNDIVASVALTPPMVGLAQWPPIGAPCGLILSKQKDLNRMQDSMESVPPLCFMTVRSSEHGCFRIDSKTAGLRRWSDA